jgi:hypothetical protein
MAVADARDLMGLGMAAQLSEIVGDTPTVLAGTGTTQAAAARINSRCTSINGQTGQTAVYIPTGTAATLPGKLLFNPYLLNYSTLSNASPIIFVGVGGYLNGTLNGSTTLTAGQSAIVWQQTGGVFYLIKNST